MRTIVYKFDGIVCWGPNGFIASIADQADWLRYCRGLPPRFPEVA